MERSLTLEIVRVTEAAALASARWVGRGDKNQADNAATTAMRNVLNTIPMDATVVIGEGEMDEAPMLYIGEKLGQDTSPKVDIAVDPLEGTIIVANGLPNGMTMLAIADEGCFLHAPDIYMDKIAVGPKAVGCIDINKSVKENVYNVANALNKDVSQVTAVLLDRERHQPIVKELREIGARIKFINNGDVAAAINTAFEEIGVDILFGLGGAPEGVLAAAALKCLGGEIQGRLMPENEEQRERCREMGLKDPSQVLHMNDMVKGDDAIFAATGVTGGEWLKGVRFLSNNRAITHTVVMRAKTGTIRFIEATHILTSNVSSPLQVQSTR